MHSENREMKELNEFTLIMFNIIEERKKCKLIRVNAKLPKVFSENEQLSSLKNALVATYLRIWTFRHVFSSLHFHLNSESLQ